MHSTCRLALWFPLLVAGCSEYHLQLQPFEYEDDDTPVSISAPSPWDDLDPGNLPDLAFVIGWNDTTDIVAESVVLDHGICVPEGLDPIEQMPPARFDVIDGGGQLIQSLEPPEGWLYPGASLWNSEVSLTSAGPGRFAAIWKTVPQPTGIYIGTGRVWVGNPLEGVDEFVADWTEGESNARVFLPLRDEEVTFDGRFDELHAAIDPTVPDTLWIAPGRENCERPHHLNEPLLYSVDYRELGSPAEAWMAEDLLPPGLPDPIQSGGAVIDRIRATDDEGRTWIAMDIVYFRDYFCLNGELQGVSQSLALTWAPDTGERRWVWDKPADLEQMAAYEPKQGEALLYSDTSRWVEAPRFEVFRPGQDTISVEPAEALCGVAGPLLDAAGPTFLYSTQDLPDGEWSSRLVVSHAGEDVWTLPHFRQGLADRSFLLRGVSAL